MTTIGCLQLYDGFGRLKIQETSRHSATSSFLFCVKALPSLQIKSTPYILRASSHLFPRRHFSSTCHALHYSEMFGNQAVKDLCASVTSIFSGDPLVLKLLPVFATIIFTLWCVRPLLRWGSNMFYNHCGYRMSDATYELLLSVLQPLFLWLGVAYICRVLVPVIMQTEANQAVKIGLLNFVKSSSAVVAFAYFVSSVLRQAKKSMLASNDPNDARTMGFQIAGKSVHIAVWVAVASLLMEVFGFATQKWLTAIGLGIVLLAFASREGRKKHTKDPRESNFGQ